MVLAPNLDEKMNNSPESMFWETIENKKTGAASKLRRPLTNKLGFFDRLDFVAQFLDRFADVVP